MHWLRQANMKAPRHKWSKCGCQGRLQPFGWCRGVGLVEVDRHGEDCAVGAVLVPAQLADVDVVDATAVVALEHAVELAGEVLHQPVLEARALKAGADVVDLDGVREGARFARQSLGDLISRLGRGDRRLLGSELVLVVQRVGGHDAAPPESVTRSVPNDFTIITQ